MGHAFATWTTELAGFGLTWLLQSSLVLSAGLLAARLGRRAGPAVQSAIYRTTLVAVLLCPVASALAPRTGIDRLTLQLPAPQAATTVEPTASATPATPETATEGPRHNDDAGRVTSTPANRSMAPADSAPGTEPRQTSRSASARVPGEAFGVSARFIAIELAIGAWLLGAFYFGLQLVVGYRRMRRLRSAAIPAEPVAVALCHELARQMRLKTPDVMRSPYLFSPCIDGVRRPAILLPDDVDDELRDTFVHELAHLARRDGLWNLTKHAANALLWFQPLLWVLSRRLEVVAEEVCDDYVVQFGADRAGYAGRLLELARRVLPPVAPAAVGMISLRSLLARRIVRILDPSRALSTRAGTLALAATLAVGGVFTGLAGLLGVVGGTPEARAENPPNARKTSNSPALQESQKPEPSNAEARPADVPVTGRVIDLEGRPVGGVRVTVQSVYPAKGNDLTAWLDSVKKGEPPWIAAKFIEFGKELSKDATRTATTDKDGRFRLERLGPERVVTLKLEAETIVCTVCDVVTRKIESIPARGYSNLYGAGFQTVFGADFTYTAPLSRPYVGVVKDAKSGQPLEGVEVRSYRFAGSDFIGTMTLRTRTDKEGRFRIAGLPKGAGNQLIVVPNDEQPYFLQDVVLPDPPGSAPASIDIALTRGIWIEGKLTEQATGKPVAGAWLHYLPFLENKFAQAHPVFDKDGNTDGTALQDRYVTRADGSFRLVGLPGRAIIGAVVHKGAYLQGAGSESIKGMNKHGHFETYRNPVNPGKLWPTVMQEIDPAPNAQSVHVDLQARTGPSVRLKVVDASGKPIIGAMTRGRTGRSSWDPDRTTQAEFEATNLMPDEARMVLVLHEERKLGKVITVHKGDDAKGPVVVTLEPLATMVGQVAETDGTPVAGVVVRPDLLPSGDFSMHLSEVSTDKDGKFRVSNVPTGCDYGFAVDDIQPLRMRRFAFLDKATVKPGETTNVGTIKFKKN
jgi:beta-lactamase regulating signal transducer with metallopeptidase domain